MITIIIQLQTGKGTWPLSRRGNSQWPIRPWRAAQIFASTEYEQDLVQSLYQKYLGRAADLTGQDSFVSALQNGAHDEDLITDLTASLEYFARS
jgi:hypothetical protein